MRCLGQLSWAAPAAFLLSAGALLPVMAAEEAIDVPSGQPVFFLDVIRGEAGPAGLTARFRFVAPQIAKQGGSVGFEEAEADMAFLCESYALPRISDTGPEVSQIVISLSDRPIAFGEADPEVTQFFDAYRPEDGACIWEGF